MEPWSTEPWNMVVRYWDDANKGNRMDRTSRAAPRGLTRGNVCYAG